MTNVMTRAWEIAKEGKENFGGSVKEYLSESLKLAWSEVNNNETTVKWENERGAVIEMTVEHINEEVVGYSELLKKNLTKKVDEMEITNLVIDGTEVNTWNTKRNRSKSTISTGRINFRGRQATIEISLPTDINEKVWGEYDKRDDRRKEKAAKMEMKQKQTDKMMSILECGA